MTKRGGGTHAFDNDLLRKYYNDYESCVFCGESGASVFDHVEPRSGIYTNSILNASPVHNHKCNIAKHGEMHTHDNKVKMILTNMKRLQRQGYVPNETDTNFIDRYKSAYDALELL